MTTAAATFVFLWGLGAYYIIKWFNQKEIPGVHTDLAGGIQKQLDVGGLGGIGGLGESVGLPALNGEAKPPATAERKKPPNAGGHNAHDGEKASSSSRSPSSTKRQQAPSGKGTGTDLHVGDVKKKVGGVTSSVGLD